MDQFRAQSLLQLRDRATDERLGALKGIGGGGEPVVLDDRPEDLHLAKTVISHRGYFRFWNTILVLMSRQDGEMSGVMSNEPARDSEIAEAPHLTDAVYQRLIGEIVDGKLPPGQRIRQAALAARLGVSRAPVSHALQLLKQRGLVRESGKMGVEVMPISSDKVRDIYQIRARMDGLAARLAAARVKNGEMPPGEAERLRRVFNVGTATAKSAPMSQQARTDAAFHQEIYAICGNASIATTMDPLWSHIERAMVLVLEAGPERQRAWAEHSDIMGAILNGQPDLTEERAFLHAANAAVFIETRLRGSR